MQHDGVASAPTADKIKTSHYFGPYVCVLMTLPYFVQYIL